MGWKGWVGSTNSVMGVDAFPPLVLHSDAHCHRAYMAFFPAASGWGGGGLNASNGGIQEEPLLKPQRRRVLSFASYILQHAVSGLSSLSQA